MENISSFMEMIRTKYATFGLFFKTESQMLSALYTILFVVVSAYAFWIITRVVLSSILKHSKKSSIININEKFLKAVRSIAGLSILTVAGSVIINIYSFIVPAKIFYALMILAIAGPVIEIIYCLLDLLEKKIVEKTESHLDDIVFHLLRKFSGITVYVFAAISALSILGVDIMPLVAGAGVAGIAIGFAAKDTLSNLIAGVLLIIDRPFEVGDRIEVWSAPKGSSTWGDVIDIGIRATKIKTTDNIVIIIPNNEIMKRDIVNYTHQSSAIRVRINIGVAYDSDIEKAKNTIIEVAKSAQWSLEEPAPKVVVRNFGDSAIDLQLRVWIDPARERMNTISYITDNVKSAFDKAGIDIPFPRRDIAFIRDKKKKETA